jgi:predicted PurR-regulated permease PerM
MTVPKTERMEVRVATSTILKLLLTAVLVWAGITLWPELVLLFVAMILAIALEPAVNWLSNHGVSRGTGVAILSVLLLLALTAIAVFVLPPLFDQVHDMMGKLPEVQQQIREEITPTEPALKKWFEGLLALPSSSSLLHMDRLVRVGEATVTGVFTVAIALVLTIYLILDGRRVYAWLLAYVPREHRAKMSETVPEVSSVVRAYVGGQLITSLLFSVFVVILLSVFNVPAVVPLALFAGICDVVPMIGIVIAIAPAALLALTTSKLAAIVVPLAYLGYHLIETYFIAPRVYGNKLRLSTLTVLLALLLGGSLFGLIGAILILPVVAAYPVVERIWLKDYLGTHVIADHGALALAVQSGDDAAVDTVLRAEKHADELPDPKPSDA